MPLLVALEAAGVFIDRALGLAGRFSGLPTVTCSPRPLHRLGGLAIGGEGLGGGAFARVMHTGIWVASLRVVGTLLCYGVCVFRGLPLGRPPDCVRFGRPSWDGLAPRLGGGSGL